MFQENKVLQSELMLLRAALAQVLQLNPFPCSIHRIIEKSFKKLLILSLLKDS